MSVRIGWSIRRPQEPRPGAIGRHVALFQYLKIEGDRAKEIVVGWLRIEAADLLRLRTKGVKLRLRVIGVLSVAEDVPPELFKDVVTRINMAGVLRAPSLARHIP